MIDDKEVIVERALSLWATWMRSDSSELRALWYPGQSIGVMSGGVVTEDAWQDLEDECNSRIVQVVNAAIDSLLPAQRVAIQQYCGMVRVFRVRDIESALAEAQARVYRALVANGCA